MILKGNFLICFILSFLLTTEISYAAAVLYRLKQKKNPQPTQEEYEQYQQQQQQQQNQTQEQPASSPPTYQQTIDQRNQAIAQAILNAHNPSVSSVEVPFGNNGDTDQVQQKAVAASIVQKPQPVPPINSSDVKDVVDLTEVWKKLDKKSTVWSLLIDDQSKLLTVSEYLDRFHKEGVKISAPPLHYVQMIDQISGQNPQLLERPFGELLQIMAIVDYDFDNGMDKDELAKKVLGEAGYEANKKRFAQTTNPQQNPTPNEQH